jgi:hypothetical protein
MHICYKKSSCSGSKYAGYMHFYASAEHIFKNFAVFSTNHTLAGLLQPV